MNNETPSHAFSSLPEIIQKNLDGLGIHTPTPIQESAIQPATTGRDVLAQSQTGSGKTLAFAIPVLVRLMASDSKGKPRALVLTPTRELTQQVAQVFSKLALGTGVKVATIIGGGSYVEQRAQLRTAHVVIGTPGRVIDFVDQKTLDLSHVEVFVLDEVDQMLDIGFAEALEKIHTLLPKNKQTLLFSATFSPRIRSIAMKMLSDPFEIKVTAGKTSADSIEHGFIECRVGVELKALMNSLLWYSPAQALVFCETKAQCAQVAESLVKRGFDAGMLNSDMNQRERTTIMNQFKNRSLRYLVATDVAARGIDVQDLPLVVNMSVPHNLESYIHRTGRTGRAGAKGAAWTIVTPRSWRVYSDFTNRAKIKSKKIELPSADQMWKRFIAQETENLVSQASSIRPGPHEKLIGEALNSLDTDTILGIARAAIAKNIQRLSLFDTKEFEVERPLDAPRKTFSKPPNKSGFRRDDREPSRGGKGGGFRRDSQDRPHFGGPKGKKDVTSGGGKKKPYRPSGKPQGSR